ncbi:hypothetical protein M885DRAFT_432764 [Pelagophyceae sp. CCMP2097]|nr:hypothetical protein M885DRAFT_432764 [Pelagophyceae sp. CCMP2097]
MDAPPAAAAPKPCCVCDAPNGKHCTKCKSRHYCGKKCQLVDWNKGGHKVQCKQLAAAFQDRLLGATALNGETPDWRGTCAICLDLLPIIGDQQTFYACCCKRICTDCSDKWKQHDTRCPLCRALNPTSATESLRRLQEHVDKGNADAQNILGYSYSQGDLGLKQSHKRAIQLYELAAAQGHAPAQNRFGHYYNVGNGVKINYKTAAHWYRRAAEQGHPQAQLNIGLMFYAGKGSYDEAARWYRLAAAQGHADALYNLGRCYANDQGVPQDYHEALRLCKRAAAKGHASAAAGVEHIAAHLAATRPGPPT